MGDGPTSSQSAGAAIAVCDADLVLDLIVGPGSAHALVHPGVGARARAMHRISLAAGSCTVALEHPSDAVYYISRGGGYAEAGTTAALVEGSMIHIEAGTGYRLRAGEEGMVLVGGPAPADPALYGAAPGPDIGQQADRSPAPPPTGDDSADRRASAPPEPMRIFHRDRPDLLMPLISSDARLVVWPGVGAHAANMNYVAMEPGEENVPHVHPSSEDTIYILEGRGSVRNHDDGSVQAFEAGQAIFVPAGVRHQVRADAGVKVVSVGGPCPPDYEMLRKLGADVAAP